MLGVPIEPSLLDPAGKESEPVLSAFFRYLDLSNYQNFLHRKKRLREDTWNDWKEGIIHNMKLPAFKAAFDVVKQGRPDAFHELRELCNQPS
jgi:hypothetical protein